MPFCTLTCTLIPDPLLQLLQDHLEAMAMSKLNVLHWHLVDDQSFPYESAALPALSEHGAFSPAAVYTRADVAEIVAFARARGIRVIPEFDTPGHVASWGAGAPRLLTDCYGRGGETTGAQGPVNPALEGSYTL